MTPIELKVLLVSGVGLSGILVSGSTQFVKRQQHRFLASHGSIQGLLTQQAMFTAVDEWEAAQGSGLAKDVPVAPSL